MKLFKKIKNYIYYKWLMFKHRKVRFILEIDYEFDNGSILNTEGAGNFLVIGKEDKKRHWVIPFGKAESSLMNLEYDERLVEIKDYEGEIYYSNGLMMKRFKNNQFIPIFMSENKYLA